MAEISRKTERYPTDLTDAEWDRIKPFLPKAPRRGRKPKTDMREVMNAIRYMARSGGGWRMLPTEFGPWQLIFEVSNLARSDTDQNAAHQHCANVFFLKGYLSAPDYIGPLGRAVLLIVHGDRPQSAACISEFYDAGAPHAVSLIARVLTTGGGRPLRTVRPRARPDCAVLPASIKVLTYPGC